MLGERSVIERVAERFGPDSFQEPTYREIFEQLLQLGESATIEALADGMSPEAIDVMQDLLAEPEAIQHLEKSVEDSLSRLELRQLEERNRAINALVPMAHGDEKDRLMAEKVANQQVIGRLLQARDK